MCAAILRSLKWWKCPRVRDSQPDKRTFAIAKYLEAFNSNVQSLYG